MILTHEYHKDKNESYRDITYQMNDDDFHAGFYIRPDLNNEIPKFDEFLTLEILNKEQVCHLQEILSDNIDDVIPKSVKIKIINLLRNSFDNHDQNKNWRILWIFVYILRNEKTFDSCYDQFISEIALCFLSSPYHRSNDDEKCLIQSLYLLEVITNRVAFRVSSEKALLLISILEDDKFASDFKLIIIKIISNHFDIDISNEILFKIYQTTKTLLKNPDLSLKSFSLRLIKKILQKNLPFLSNDELDFFYSFANLKIAEISIDAIQIFDLYASNPSNCEQLIQFNLIEKLLELFLFQNPNVSKYILHVLVSISDQSEIGAKKVYNNLKISSFFSSSFINQKLILHIIYNLAKHKIINSLFLISEDSFDFVTSFLDAEDEEIIILSLKTIQILQSDLINHLESNIINMLESLSSHSDEQISLNSRTLLNLIKDLHV